MKWHKKIWANHFKYGGIWGSLSNPKMNKRESEWPWDYGDIWKLINGEEVYSELKNYENNIMIKWVLPVVNKQWKVTWRTF